jgi:hypothetical protein
MSDAHRLDRVVHKAVRRRPGILATTAFILCGMWTAGVAAQAHGPASVVVAFVEAFNRHDVDAMIDLSHPDVRWMSVDGDAVVTETSSVIALRSAMDAYFRDVPSARSELESIDASGRFVHTVERASWEAGNTRMSQCSVSVYEVGSGLIENVWYFPTHACDALDDGHGTAPSAQNP